MKAKVRALERQRSRSPQVIVALTTTVCGVLWLLTLLASEASWIVVTLFWMLAGGALTLWLLHDLRHDLGHVPAMAQGLRSALARDEAEVFDVRASAFAELEEFEDEGACYVFQLDDDHLLFLCGQEFYPSARFPSLDFSLVYPLDETGRVADMYLEKRGRAAQPTRILPPETREHLHLDDSLVLRAGRIDEL